MTFADITVVPVSQDRKSEYLAFSKRMAVVYRDHGAIRIVDYWQASTAADPDDFHPVARRRHRRHPTSRPARS